MNRWLKLVVLILIAGTSGYFTVNHGIKTNQKETYFYESTVRISNGSGVIIASEFVPKRGHYVNYILTCNHIVGIINFVQTFTFSDDTGEVKGSWTYPAKILVQDAVYDYAIVEIITPMQLVVAKIESNVKIGEVVIAAGAPLGELFWLSDGIVSSLRTSNMIGHSAPINGGNSGGPLYNQHGMLVGINVYTKIEDGIRSDNMAYALKIKVVEQSLINKGLIFCR